MKIITLIGSSTQRKEFEKQIERLVLANYCPLSIGIYLGDKIKNYNDENELKNKLRKAHRQRIDLGEIIGIIRKSDGSIGSDTLDEIIYAHSQSKLIKYAEDIIYNGIKRYIQKTKNHTRKSKC